MKKRYDGLVEKMAKEFRREHATCCAVTPPQGVSVSVAYVGFKRSIARLKLSHVFQVKVRERKLWIYLR